MINRPRVSFETVLVTASRVRRRPRRQSARHTRERPRVPTRVHDRPMRVGSRGGRLSCVLLLDDSHIGCDADSAALRTRPRHTLAGPSRDARRHTRDGHRAPLGASLSSSLAEFDEEGELS